MNLKGNKPHLSPILDGDSETPARLRRQRTRDAVTCDGRKWLPCAAAKRRSRCWRGREGVAGWEEGDGKGGKEGEGCEGERCEEGKRQVHRVHMDRSRWGFLFVRFFRFGSWMVVLKVATDMHKVAWFRAQK